MQISRTAMRRLQRRGHSCYLNQDRAYLPLLSSQWRLSPFVTQSQRTPQTQTKNGTIKFHLFTQQLKCAIKPTSNLQTLLATSPTRPILTAAYFTLSSLLKNISDQADTLVPTLIHF